MTNKEMIEIIQAYEDGKTIQIKHKVPIAKWDEEWKDIVLDGWQFDFASTLYRIKPEPKYRPYKDTDEMISDFKQRFEVKEPYYCMPLIWVESKTTTNRYLIVGYYREKGVIQGVRINAYKYNLEDLFADYTYLDNTPVGKLE